MYSYLKPIIKTISNLVSEQSAFSVALLLGLEPVGVALTAAVVERQATLLRVVEVPVEVHVQVELLVIKKEPFYELSFF